jgi:F-type H+-transporting ATPase subunit delta
MSSLVSSKRYAQAIFQIAGEKNEFEEWQNNLRKIAYIMRDENFALIVESPKLRFEQKSKLIDTILGKIDPFALNFAYLLVVKNKTRSAGEIADQFEVLVDVQKGIKHAEIISAIPLEEAEKNKIVDKLEQIIGLKLRPTFSVNKDILGGFIARIDGSLIDGSIKNRLYLLRNNISTASK